MLGTQNNTPNTFFFFFFEVNKRAILHQTPDVDPKCRHINMSISDYTGCPNW